MRPRPVNNAIPDGEIVVMAHLDEIALSSSAWIWTALAGGRPARRRLSLEVSFP